MRRIIPIILGGAVVLAAIAWVTSRSEPYQLEVALDDAAGLRDGSPVQQGGVSIGKVKLKIGSDDRITAKLEIDDDHAPLHQGVRVGITSINLLGQKSVKIDDPAQGPEAADGWRVPSKDVSVSTDLDQVLNVLDAGTRARLTIFLSEAGNAVAGRRLDLRRVIGELPTALDRLDDLLDELVSDNQNLGSLVESGDRFVAEMSARRREVTKLVGTLGGTAKTLAERRAALQQTLARAPGTLRQLQAFLADLTATTKPLKPAAQEISASAPLLDDVLRQVAPFTESARPTLKAATQAAPALTRLGKQATPVLRLATPTASSLADLTEKLPPLSQAIGKSTNNLFALADNWTKAIQFRDGLSHVFRGEAIVPLDTATSVLARLSPTATKKTGGQSTAGSSSGAPSDEASPPTPSKGPQANAPEKLNDLVPKVTGALQELPKTLNDTVKGLLGGPGGRDGAGPPPANEGTVSGLLDYLLGG
ncbi:hypothetical protein DSM112329_04227 [Paraconexibacter sp. AEG42_29]|uniref:Mce/MlaD domain-containing protein n=1 Tax=Paraconexibacter sp. AEG42_29 TaxID=2997339 RepID=A0AAU7B015_9ACTN